MPAAPSKPVLGALYALRQQPERVSWLGEVPDFTEGAQLLARHAAALFGPPPMARPVRIMVTMPSEAAADYALVRKLLQRGMDCMRINCAHDDEAAWMLMVEHLERARLEIGRPCAVQMDLGGPKIRTGEIEPGPAVLKVKPVRDRLGAVVRPAVLGLVAVGAATAVVGIDVAVPVDRVPAAAPGDRLWFEDARGRRRSMRVRHTAPGVLVVDVDRTAYILPGTRIQGVEAGPHCTVADLLPTPGQIILRRGDVLRLLRRPGPGRAAATDAAGRSLSLAEIGVTDPAIFDDLEPGHHVWLDDGKIGAVVRSVHADGADVEVVMAAAGGSSLKAGKGVNLPDTVVTLPALTAVDLQHLDFVACHADLVGYSFVRSVDDVARLQAELAKRQAARLGIVLKIETRQAFDHLPQLLLAALRSERAGVMIARGDLAVECGFERMAEVQEEILWLCEAAHVPVIWATQVLESLAKTGTPTRAEVTDAAMAERAECVMLNKGPYVADAVQVLDDILQRLHAHQSKKRPMLRSLRIASLSPA